jgi:hypothetical protein
VGGLLTAPWAAARVAVSPGHQVPGFGPGVVVAVCRALTRGTLEPIIGASGSPLLFWVVLAVFLALFTLTAARVAFSLPQPTPRGLPPAGAPPVFTEPSVVPLAWPRSARGPAAPTIRPAATPAAHHPSGLHPGADASAGAPEQTAESYTRSADAPDSGGGNPVGVWVSIGVAGDQPVRWDLCAHRGLGLTGPGADGCARHILVDLLTHAEPATAATRGEPEPALVVLPAADATRLLGGHARLDTAHRFTQRQVAGGVDGAEPDRVGQRVYQAPTLGVALTYLEQQLLARARTSAHRAPRSVVVTGPSVGGPLVLFARPDHACRARLQAILAHGARYRIAAVVGGPWPSGTTLSLDGDGTVHTPATRPALRSAAPRLTRTYIVSGHDLQALLQRPIPPAQRPIPPPAPEIPTTPGTPTTPSVPPEAATEPTGDPTATREGQTRARPSTRPGGARSDTTSTPRREPPPSGRLHAQGHAVPPDSVDTVAGPTASERDTAVHQPDRAPTAAATEDPGARVRARLDVVTARAVLRVSCFGGLRVRARTSAKAGTAGTCAGDEIAGRDITAQLSRQDTRLLACLALHPRGIPASSLLEILWPGAQPRSGGQRLRTALNHLRTTLREATDLPDASLVGHLQGRYHLGAHPDDPHLWIDYTTFDTAVQIARTHTGAARLDALYTIAALYTGTLLGGIDLDWPDLSTLQEAARRSATAARAHLAEHYARGDPAQAVELLRSLLTHEPTVE